MLPVFFSFWEISKKFITYRLYAYIIFFTIFLQKSFANFIKNNDCIFKSIAEKQTRVLLYSREMCKHGNIPNIECNTFALRLIPGTRQNNLRGDRLAFWNWANGYGDYGRKQKVVSVFWIEIGVYKFQIKESYEVRPK